MIVVDASVLIDHLGGRAEARQARRRAVEQDHLLTASVLTKIEITAGMRSAGSPDVQALFRVVEWLPVTDQIANDAGALARRYRKSHHTIDVVDFVIAATAQSLGADV